MERRQPPPQPVEVLAPFRRRGPEAWRCGLLLRVVDRGRGCGLCVVRLYGYRVRPDRKILVSVDRVRPRKWSPRDPATC